MKFADIKPLYSAQNMYGVDQPVKYILDTLKRYKEEYGLEMVPDFQRGHVWTKEQQEKYIEFLLRGGKAGTDFYFNHPGWMGDFNGQMVCVDGLQRITALQQFFNNEICAFNTYYQDFKDNFPLLLVVRFYINNLKNKEDVLNWYVELNETGTPHSQEELQKVKDMIEEIQNKDNEENHISPSM